MRDFKFLTNKGVTPKVSIVPKSPKKNDITYWRQVINQVLANHPLEKDWQKFDTNNFCYWSIGDGQYAHMVQALVKSAREVGVKTDFHVWTDIDINGAIRHDCGTFDKKNYLFKLDFLYRQVKELNYDYYVFLDSDCFFVNHPSYKRTSEEYGSPIYSYIEDLLIKNIHNRIPTNPVFIQMESNCTSPRNRRGDWWSMKCPDYINLVRALSPKVEPQVYNTNAGFWIIRRDAIELVYDLAMNFWKAAKDLHNVEFTEEAPLAFVGHALQENPVAQSFKNTSQYWASDWTARFTSGVPDSEPWEFEDYMSGEKSIINPAIVHAMRIDNHLVAYGKQK